MNLQKNWINFLLSCGFLSLYPPTALGGSNNGLSAAPVGFSCDSRQTFAKSFGSWCTNVNAQIIKNKCVVAVHVNAPIQNCGWQGCGFISFVNERPILTDAGIVLEYGIPTPSGVTQIPPAWEFQNGTVMPKAPFPRHYLTVDQFKAERAKCALMSVADRDAEIAKGSVLGKICGVSESTMSLNPYYLCMVNQGLMK